MPIQDPNIENIYPLTPLQQGMLFESLLTPGSGVYFGQFIYTLSGKLDAPAFQTAWKKVVDRHASLRTLFAWKNQDKPLQIVRRRVDLPWEFEDWRALPNQVQRNKLEEFLQTDRKAGFDLSHAPLMRLKFIRTAEDRHELIWSNHHLLLDGWSSYMVLNEVMEIYRGICEQRDVVLENRRPYHDFIRWLQQQDSGKVEAFWRATLVGFNAPTPFNVDQAEKKQSGQFAEIQNQEIEIPFETTDRFKAFCRQRNLTLNTLMQAAWALLLSHYSGEEDVLFGSVFSGRPAELPGAESMVGMFINTLPIRARIRTGDLISPWLESFQSQLAELREYEQSPLVQMQGWSGVPRGQPLFESLFDFANYPIDPSMRQQRGGVQLTNVRAIEKSNYPLGVIVVSRDRLIVRITYDTRRFDTATIARMLGHYQTLLEGIVANPEQRLSELPMLTDAERRQILVEWNQTQREYPRNKCVHELFEEQVERTPDAVAVVFEDHRLSYRQLNERANQLAHHLRKLGVGPDVMVGICVERSLEMAVGLLGILKAGGAFVPLDPEYPKERLEFMIKDSEPRALVIQEKSRDILAVYSGPVVCLDGGKGPVSSESNSVAACPPNPANLAYVIYTSGSTGRPKGVLLEHRGLCNLAIAQAEHLGITPQSRVLQFASMSFDASVWEIFGALLAGAALVLARKEDLMPGVDMVQLLKDQAITVVTLPPSVLAVLPEDAFPKLLTVVSAGEACPVEIMTRWRRGRRFINAYGPTESTVCASLSICQEDSTKPSIGRPIANTQIYILDRNLQPVPVGVPGELHIGGIGLARGYRNRPELTAEKFIAHPFSNDPKARLYKTGDLARYLPDGNIEYLGRLDHQVKIRGFRIELGEIEAQLNQHAAVREAVVVAREDTPGDKRLVAYTTPKNGKPPTVSELRELLKVKLPEYMVPSAFVTLERFPMTPNGKVDRKALPKPEYESAGSEFLPPSTPTEITLAKIWCEILGVKQVSTNDSFFDLGGQSLLATRLVSQVANVFHVYLPLRTVFEHPCQGDLARQIDIMLWACRGTEDGAKDSNGAFTEGRL